MSPIDGFVLDLDGRVRLGAVVLPNTVEALTELHRWDKRMLEVLMGHQAGMQTACTLTGASTRADALAASPAPHHIIDTLIDLLPLTQN